MPNENPSPKPDRRWIFAAVIMGVAAGFALAIVAQSRIALERFDVDCVDSFSHLARHHAGMLAITVSSGGAGFWSGAYRLGGGVYRLAQGTRYAMIAKGYLARRFSA